MGLGEIRVFVDGRLEKIQGLAVRFETRPGVEIEPLEIKAVRLGVFRGPLPEGGLFPDLQSHLQAVHDRCRDLVLDSEDIGHFPVVALRPEMEAVLDVDELGRDAQMVAGLAYAPFEHGLDIEPPADLPDIEVHAFESEGRGAGHDPQVLNVGQGIDQLLSDPFAEIFLVFVRAHIGEGEDGDRRWFSPGNGGWSRSHISEVD